MSFAVIAVKLSNFYVSKFPVETQSSIIVFTDFQTAFHRAFLPKNLFNFPEKLLSYSLSPMNWHNVDGEYVSGGQFSVDVDSSYYETGYVAVDASNQTDRVVVSQQVGYLLFWKGFVFEALLFYFAKFIQKPK